MVNINKKAKAGLAILLSVMGVSGLPLAREGVGFDLGKPKY